MRDRFRGGHKALLWAFIEGLKANKTIREALSMRAKTMNYPVWAVIEMAIAGYLDEEALSFVDCKPKLD
ncbi:MAG: hypothetical protein EAZ96_24535 [Oscillatoriales cyanobacterium]|nr:MAG: hypothetical protein EAZ96_24535 [Oscillatoriales cyanobacterium]